MSFLKERKVLLQEWKYHEIYIFQIPNYQLKIYEYIPLCLRCLNFSIRAFNNFPRKKECKYKFKTMEKFPKNFKKIVITVFNWFLHHIYCNSKKCCNPECKNPLHYSAIKDSIRRLNNLIRINNLIENKIPIVFLCCYCNKKRDEIKEIE
jgi:hypothetical protein